MKSFHGSEEVKKKYLDRVSHHIAADDLIRGTGWNGQKGCAIGCTLEDYNHGAYETQLGLPEWFAYLEDKLFEGMSFEKSKTWPRDLLEAIPVGVSIEKIKWKFSAILLKENIDRVLSLNEITDELKWQVVSSIRQCLAVNEMAIDSGEWDESAAESARSAAESARSAAESAARSAAESAAWSARSAAESAARSAAESAAWSARSAAWSAAWSARSAAESAAESAAWSARSAESAAYDRYADILLTLLRELK